MPRKVEEIPKRAEHLYPWDEWITGELLEFVKGEDFVSDTRTFANAARNAANRRAATVEHVEVTIRGDSVFLRFVLRSVPLTETR